MESSDPNPGRPDPRGTGISPQTLLIASVAAAAASFAVSRIWGPGTLISAAATPVIVAIVSEFLKRPVQTVTETARKVPVPPVVPVRRPGSRAPQPPGSSAPQSPEPEAPEPDWSNVAYAEAETRRPPRWRVAVLTGLAAFAIVVGFYTLPDLVSGRSITGSGDSTTFFGGSRHSKKQPKDPAEEQAPKPAQTVTTTVTTPPTTTTQPPKTTPRPATTTPKPRTTAPAPATTPTTPAPTTTPPTTTTVPPAP